MGEGTFGFNIPTINISGAFSYGAQAAIDAICGKGGCVNEAQPDCALFAQELRAWGRIKARSFLVQRFLQGFPEVCPGATKLAIAYLVPPLDDLDVDLLTRGQQMGFGDFLLDNVIKPIGGAIGSVVTNLPTIANTVAGAAQSIQAIQASLGGMPTMVAGINPATGSSGGVQGPVWTQEAFAAACNADPTGQCQAAIAAALGGGGGMTMPGMNVTTGSPIQAGVLGPLISNPAVQQALRALGLGALIGAGTEAVGAIGGGIAGLLGGGSSAGATGPLLMNWPAATPLPRSIVLRAPDKPEKRYRTVGAPLLSSGDVAAVRRVQKAASRARKGRGRRSSARQPQVIQIGGGTHHVCGKCLSSPCGCS